ncbi:phytanoyl-CoA dioxygenase family protein [Sphingomonas sp.]|jgi:ectoine hydroxylase-related dioxygenase (phytanoyl-CoA dioxygenase family)|uniref:phytanoyl-CoA dioxygenase family protein n=1 Tax=Sphingomonas sp. TaxID=28214 RepID=UPI0017A9805E|nr:phytanoyl-CoA dioxygenase family protein [Sphingomonas sp.]MBA4760904.1 phytanoyl-CoA dioxygenase family protein [Sphingomonas sp.]
MDRNPMLATAIDQTRARLARDGWCVLRAALPPETIAALDADLAPTFAQTPFCQGSFYGETTKRFGRLLARSERMAALVQHAVVQGVVEAILAPWCDCIQLNVAQAIAIHPESPAQIPHRDQDMWRGPVGEIEYLVNVIWPLTPFRAANGATLVWSNTHGAAALDPPPTSAGTAAEMEPGDALLFLGSTLHGAGANRTTGVRRGLVVGYSLGWLKPYESQMLAYPPDVARAFPPDLAALVGYRQHRPNLGNYEGQCPSVLLAGTADMPRAAIDALRPDQRDQVEAFRRGQAEP